MLVVPFLFKIIPKLIISHLAIYFDVLQLTIELDYVFLSDEYTLC